MKGLVILSLVFAICTLVNGADPDPAKLFDCNRGDQMCVAGTCGATTGECTCTENNSGFACQVASSTEKGDQTGDCGAADSGPCKNGGKCMNNEKCACLSEFSGDHCEKPPIVLDCGVLDNINQNSEMKLNIAGLYGVGDTNTANAQIMVEGADVGEAADAACFSTPNAVEISVTNSYPDADGKTLPCQKATKPDATQEVYIRKFIVRFEFGTTSTNTDFRVTATCSKDGGTIKIESDVITVDTSTADEKLPNHDIGQSATGAVVTLDMQINNAAVVAGTEYLLTDTVMITLTLDTTQPKDKVFAAIRLEKFDINNKGADAATLKELNLMEDGCPTKYEDIVVKTSVTRKDNKPNVLILQTSPIILDGTKLNFYIFIVKVCKTGKETDCAPMPACPAVNARRRRRSAGDDLATLGAGFTIRDQVQRSISDLRDDIKNQKDCVLTSEITATLVAMGVAILLLLVLVIVLSVRAILGHRRDVTMYQHHNMETASTTSLPKMVNAGY